MSEGKHQHPATMRLTGAVALAVAIGAAGYMLSLKPQGSPAPAAAVASTQANQQPKLAEAFPNAPKPAELPGVLPDGAYFTPLFFPQPTRALGTAVAPGGDTRLVWFDGTQVTELRKLAKDQAPSFGGFVSDGKKVAWVELTAGADGSGDSRIWTADAGGGAARQLTADTGDVVLFDKQDDMVIHDGELSWIAAAPTDELQTEIRTVKLTGGKVHVTTVKGTYSFATWPWIATFTNGQEAPIELLDLTTQRKIVVKDQQNELIACSSTWCRVLIVGATDGSTIIEMMRPDGSERVRTAVGKVAAATVDVALLDRYEIYSRSNGSLELYDLPARKTITITTAAKQILSRNAVLWWSTGDNETTKWHVLDLRTLQPTG